MAVKKIIEIVADVQQASKEIGELFDKMLKQEIENQKQTEKLVDSVEDIGKTAKQNQKSIKGMADGFKGVGLAIKAMGVGLVLEAFNILKDLFMQNQKVADVFSTAMKALGIVFNDLFGFITNNAPKVIDFFKGIFENPQQAVKDFGNLIKANLIERFQSLIDMLGYAGEAFKNLFTGDFDAAIESAKKAGKEFIDVNTGIANSFDRGTELVKNGVDALLKYGKETIETASNMVKLENAAKLAEAQQARLVEQYDRSAEKLRQVRDNDLLSISDRIKANNDLAKVLDKQEAAMIKQADLQIAAAKNTLALNNNIDNQVALTNALANREGVLAQIEGFRSEQKANAVALEKELLELNNSRIESETKLANDQKKFEAERKKDTETRLQLEKEALEEEKRIDLERLQNKINLYVQGTQARLDAEIEYNTRKQELDNAITLKEDEIALNKFTTEKTRLEEIFNAENESFALRLQALQNYNALVQASTQLTEDEKRKAQEETFRQQQALEQQRLSLVSQTAGNIATVLGENSKTGKAFAVAQALINTYQGITAELATKTATPFEFGLKIANIATTAAIGFKTVKDILKTNPSASGGGSAGGSSGVSAGASAPAPQFNLVGNTGVNQIAATVGQDQTVSRAYVVASDVTTQQGLDRNTVQNATIG